MIIYKCKCGDEFIARDNTEGERKNKVAFKKLHGNRKGYSRQYKAETLIHNPGHGYTRQIGRKND